MFQFTTTTILNSSVDASGKTKWAVDTDKGTFYVLGVNKFIGANLSVYKREASLPKIAKATLELESGITYGAGDYQLNIYLNYQGSQNSFYATPMSYTKGKPLFYAFSLTGEEATGQAVAEKIVKVATWMNTRFDNKWLDISNTQGTLNINGIDEYQRFVTVKIERFETDAYGNAIWKTVEEALPAAEDGTFPNAGGTIVQGREGFGTYTQLLKDLRLPTAANTNWLALNQEERPIPGELYDQYTLQYTKDRGLMGQSAVGQLATSSTTHVFYVRRGLTPNFDVVDEVAASYEVVEGPAGYPTVAVTKKYARPTNKVAESLS
jgi:hypothetical protein